MRKISTVLLFVVSIVNSNAQDFVDKMSKLTCKCLEKSKLENHEQAFKVCVEDVMLDHMKELKEYYHVQSVSEVDTKDFGAKLATKLLKDCELAYNYFYKENLTKEDAPKTYVVNDTLNCESLQNADYYYLTENQSNSFDTTHVIIDKGDYLEIIGLDQTYSKLSIKWRSNCRFQLTFIESNDELKNRYSKKGDTYEYEIVQNHPDRIVVRMLFHGDEYFTEFFKE